ncbi:MAG: 3-deoxy-D-manno-octulosonic-acid transferase [Candidatus Magnetoglobus multicellularis str. Araruama]|uniref:3-deoxy-D-manno-octulosonic acid transferase n=1 Tax=Candidatus Magnetoglobus multicellularis str. Araruama TaxID=890399 RepID=A0A1V1P9H6_9BACT|nr:MAG: 3-deoxy-D-manno-octulosonic-acid transferase [Candidatus Magnetoglobus multicellularis str. Araruama]
MNFFFLVYICLTSVMMLFIIPFVLICVIVTGRYKNLVFQRLGVYPRLSHLKKHRIWLHAVSVGEVNVARALIDALFQMHSDIDIILSTTTPRGYELACKMSHPRVQCVYSPIDFIASVRLAFHKIQPDILVLLETEIWPNWIFTAKALNVPVVVANGRISMKTVQSFQKIAPLVQFIVKKIDAFSMISTEDAHRICKTGVSPKKVFVTGNAKFDLLEKIIPPNYQQH